MIENNMMENLIKQKRFQLEKDLIRLMCKYIELDENNLITKMNIKMDIEEPMVLNLEIIIP